MKKFIVLLMTLVAVFMISCAEPETPKFTVTFEGIDHEAVVVTAGEKFKLPEDLPTPEAGKKLVIKMGDTVLAAGQEYEITADTVLKCSFETLKYALTIDGVAQTVEYGHKVDIVRTQEGKKFISVMVNGVEYAEDVVVVTKDTEIVYKWNDIYTVSFEGVEHAPVKVCSGDAFSIPEDMLVEVEGARPVMYFVGEKGYFIDEKMIVTKDVTLNVRLSDQKLTVDDSGMVTKAECTGELLAIPKSIDGKEIKKIGYQFLRDQSNVKDVYIQEGVSSISSDAFEYSKVVNITYPSSITSVEYGAFNTDSIMKLKTAGSLNHGWKAGWDNGFKGIVISTETFADAAGNRYANTLDSEGNEVAVLVEASADSSDFTVPASVDGKKVWGISNDVFAENNTVRNLVVSEGIEYIGVRAFYNSSIESITLPASLRTIGDWAFANTSFMTAIALPEGVECIGGYAFAKSGIETLKLPSTLVELSPYALSKMGNVTELALPASIKALPESVLSDNSKLEKIVLPAGLESIGAYAFSDSCNISNIELPNGVKLTGIGVFFNWTADQTISFASRSDMLGSSDNWNVECNAKFEFRDDIVLEGYTYAHIDAEHLRLVDIPDSTGIITIKAEVHDPAVGKELPVTEIGDGIFKDNKNITEVTIEEGFTKIGSNLFRNSSIEKITLPATLEEISDSAFAWCESLKSVEIPANVHTMGKEAFSH